MSATSRYAPIALFAYNRPEHLRLTLEALRRNDLAAESDLVVFSDGARDAAAQPAVSDVRRIVASLTGFRSIDVVERPRNLGLAASIIDGVTTVCGRHGRIIVVEDDLVTSPFFLRYMNGALALYEGAEEVGSVHGYWYPVSGSIPETFFLRGASCWGWATWSRAWSQFETDGRKLLAELQKRRLTLQFDIDGAIGYTQMLKSQIAGRNNSWAIRWHASMFLRGRLQLWTRTSLVRNIGFDGTGTHCAESEAYAVTLAEHPVRLERQPLVESTAARALLARYHRGTRRSLATRVAGRLRRIVRL